MREMWKSFLQEVQMSDEECPGADGLVCIDGWLYSQFQTRMMIFSANKRCPKCNAIPDEVDENCHHDA